MDKKQLIETIAISIRRLGLFYSEETKSLLWELDETVLFVLIDFLNKLNRFYSKKG